jgi:hypothetical protein
MRSRTQGALAFGTILGVCTAGILHLAWWAAVAGACILTLISISNHPLTYRVLGGHTTSGILLLSSILNASLTSVAALGIGRGIGWLWGV